MPLSGGRTPLVLSLAVLAAACAPAPPPAARVSPSDIQLPTSIKIVEGRVPRNVTLAGLLSVHQIGADLTQLIVDAVRTAFDPRRLRAGQPYQIARTIEGLFQSFEYGIDDDRYLRVANPEDGFPAGLSAEIIAYPKRVETVAVSGTIDREHPSLVAAMDRSGERVDLALQLAQVFAGQVDFNADLQPGDYFEALFEKQFRTDEEAVFGYGPVSAATIVNSGRRLQAFRFEGSDGRPGYYDENGRSVRRFFLRSPLPFDPRVTSRFSRRRLHPILGVNRAHLGVDYAARTGTPVLAVADGRVISAGYSGGSGRMVRLQHANDYQTYYLHLSSIARGVRAGARVTQGMLIGRVGSTGLATGPHLDYRMARRGIFVDPLLEHRRLPPGDPVPESSLAAFHAVRDDAVSRLASRLGGSPVLASAEPAPAPPLEPAR